MRSGGGKSQAECGGKLTSLDEDLHVGGGDDRFCGGVDGSFL